MAVGHRCFHQDPIVEDAYKERFLMAARPQAT
jgi:hypothetical protein